jgi:hypothetical protein
VIIILDIPDIGHFFFRSKGLDKHDTVIGTHENVIFADVIIINHLPDETSNLGEGCVLGYALIAKVP